LPPDDSLARLHAAVGRRQLPDHTGLLDAALRAIGRHHHQAGLALPELAQATLTTERISFSWASPASSPPAGFEGDHAGWWVALPADGSNPLGPIVHPCAYPALVSLGTSATGDTVLVDLERSGVVGVAAEQRELQLASLASIAVELACAPWASELALVSVGADGELARAAGGETVTWLKDAGAALVRLRQRHSQRRRELEGLDLSRLRTDPERADAIAPQVYVFHCPLTAAQRQEIDDLLAGPRLGIAAVVLAEAGAGAQWELFGDPLHPGGRFEGGRLDAHAIPESTRAAVASWYQVAETTDTEPAPWWSDSDASNLRLLPSRHPPSEDPVDIVSLRRLVRPHPTLLLIGPIDLTGAAGPGPSRARYQLMELCSWLLEHPGRTATEMAAGLGIAETTRRSNLSRLRAWLGSDPEGEPYLPEAYSGRIRLHPDVTSDVMQLRLLTGPGVNRIGEDGLVAALDLVRGDMLADAAPSQWYWADGLRSDVAATLRDAGLVLVDRALHRQELDLARWAAERALIVAPEDELLMCARIRTEHAAGNRPGVERHVLRLTQQARALGVDLMPQTVMLCQQVMEGRPRARRA
ncbi:MAG: bacterial transcriptional activator domain-containing protein, partial [Propionibacteriaceae bacterium]|nr:bacterial transcriptional activator domain-containing protein [Propionibacteriaceae bacterium]